MSVECLWDKGTGATFHTEHQAGPASKHEVHDVDKRAPQANSGDGWIEGPCTEVLAV